MTTSSVGTPGPYQANAYTTQQTSTTSDASTQHRGPAAVTPGRGFERAAFTSLPTGARQSPSFQSRYDFQGSHVGSRQSGGLGASRHVNGSAARVEVGRRPGIWRSGSGGASAARGAISASRPAVAVSQPSPPPRRQTSSGYESRVPRAPAATSPNLPTSHGLQRLAYDTAQPQPLDGYLRNRVMRLLDKGITEVQSALRGLANPSSWNPRIRAALDRLYPGGLQGGAQRDYVERQLQWIGYGMGQSRAKGASNIGLLPTMVGAGHAHRGTDNIHFTRSGLSSPSEDFLVKTMTHEHAHLYAQGALTDMWYVNNQLQRHGTYYNNMAPFTFANAAQNAETLARTAEVFSTDRYSPG